MATSSYQHELTTIYIHHLGLLVETLSKEVLDYPDKVEENLALVLLPIQKPPLQQLRYPITNMPISGEVLLRALEELISHWRHLISMEIQSACNQIMLPTSYNQEI